MSKVTYTETEFEIKNNKFKLFLYIGIPLIILISVIFNFLSYVIVILVFFFLIFFSKISYEKYHKDRKRFAEKHNLKYLKNTEVEKSEYINDDCRIFKVGHTKFVQMAMIGNCVRFPIRIFEYGYMIGGGKNQKTIIFTICELEISNTIFPHIFLRSKNSRHHRGRRIFGKNKDVKISLEDKYKKYFSLYCTENYEIEALQIFTDEILNYLLEHSKNFSIEFASNKVYFYGNKVLQPEKELEELYDVVNKIIEKIGEFLHRLSSDFDSLHEVYKR